MLQEVSIKEVYCKEINTVVEGLWKRRSVGSTAKIVLPLTGGERENGKRCSCVAVT